MNPTTERYGRSTLAEADEDVAAVALLLGYAVEIHRAPDTTVFVMPDEQLVRQFQGAARCWSLYKLPLHYPGFQLARKRLARVQNAMRIVGKARELVAPPP